MIRLGARLALAGGREALTRLGLIAVAVALGVAMLLVTLAALNGVAAQNARYAWLETGYTATSFAPAHGGKSDPLWWRLRADYYQGKRIGRVDLAATGSRSPVPPGITALPQPGQYYASPALARLLRTTPAAQLADRYPGTLAGTIGPAALPAPNSLLIVIGHNADELAHDDAQRVNAISTTAPTDCGVNCAPAVGIDAAGITLVLSVVAAALLFPVLMFIGGATRLSAARREHRFAAMRLIGATPRQISVIATVESSLAAIAGVVLGIALFFAVRPSVASIQFTAEPFFDSDLSLTTRDLVVVALGIPIAAAIAAQVALRRVTISPLGVTRRTTPPAPRGWRVLPLVAGVVELGYLAYFTDIGDNHKHSSTTQAGAYLAGVLLIMMGLVIAGPWLTLQSSRLLAARANRPAMLIAARRLADNPQASFRAVSGLVLALFIGTCALAIITTLVAHDGGAADDSPGSADTLVTGFVRHDAPASKTVSPAVAALTATPGVSGVTVVRAVPTSRPTPFPPRTLASCAELARTPALGRCPRSAEVVAIDLDFGGAVVEKSRMADRTWPAARRTLAQLAALPVDTVAVSTDGSTSAIERVRTVLGAAYPTTFAPQTLSEIKSEGTRELDNYRQLADVVIFTSLPIAGCSLAVSVAGGLTERKRPFSLLRLTGAPLAMLRRVITLEAAGPLIVTALVSIGAGLLAAHLFLHAQLAQAMTAPSLQYWLIVVTGLVASLAVIASTMPLLRRMTGPEVARND